MSRRSLTAKADSAFSRSPSFLTLPESDFQDACRRLAEAAGDANPDVIVGIATGGVHVAAAMQPHFESDPSSVVVRLSRPGTIVKQRLGGGLLLSRLPRRVAYLLRWLEVVWRERMLRARPTTEAMPPEVDTVAQNALAAARRVLVVDDTIDSGRTLQAVAGAVRSYNPACEIRTAALASTWRQPPVSPDYLLYPRSLVRFHWSMDVRA